MLDNGYGKIFKQIFAGTLRADWKALVTFEQLIVLSDCDGVVDLPHEVIHNITGIPLDIIQHGISVLEQPDPRSRSREFEGRRIERLDDHRDWGWRIVNHRYYRDLASRDDKRTADRVRVAEKRGRERSENANKTSVSQPVAECRAESRMSPTHTQTHTHTDLNTTSAEASSAPVFITIPLNTGEEFPIHENQCAEWGTLFPAVDVPQELRAMRAWCIANPRNRKTRTGIMRFATSWISRAQNRAPSNGGPHATRERVDKPSLAERATEARRNFERCQDGPAKPAADG